MANYKTTARVTQIFDDLAKYLLFCQNYGFVYNEADLYNTRIYSFRQFQKTLMGKQVRSQWEVDLARFKELEATGR